MANSTTASRSLWIPKRFRKVLHTFPWSLGVAIGMLIFFLPHPDWHGDLLNFRTGIEELRHPYWARWIFAAMNLPSEPVAFVILSLICIGLLYFAVRLYGGKHWVVFTSFAFAWTLIYGQIDAIVVGGLALAWWAIQKKNAYLVGAGLILASIKPQMGLFLGLALWWWSPSRWKALVIPAMVFVLSLIQWGWWVPTWMDALLETDFLTSLTRNISLWTIFSWWIWLAWPLVFALPVDRPRKLLAIAATTAMTVPYFPLPSAVLFLVMPIPTAIYAALQIPLISNIFGLDIYFLMKLIPPALLIWAAWPFLAEKIQILRLADRKTQ